MRILVAEDEPHIATLIQFTLEMEGHAVAVAPDGLQALELALSTLPDLILLDLKMPKLNGWQVLERLKADERASGIPVIVVSAFAQKESQEHSRELGAAEFMSKPFRGPDLIACVRRVTGSAPSA